MVCIGHSKCTTIVHCSLLHNVNETLRHELTCEHILSCGEDYNSHDPTLLHNVIKLGLFWIERPSSFVLIQPPSEDRVYAADLGCILLRPSRPGRSVRYELVWSSYFICSLSHPYSHHLATELSFSVDQNVEKMWTISCLIEYLHWIIFFWRVRLDFCCHYLFENQSHPVPPGGASVARGWKDTLVARIWRSLWIGTV